MKPDFISRVPKNPIDAIDFLVECYIEFFSKNSSKEKELFTNELNSFDLAEFLAIYKITNKALIKINESPIIEDTALFRISRGEEFIFKENSLKKVVNLLKITNHHKVESYLLGVDDIFDEMDRDPDPVFKLDQGEKNKIFNLIGEMRTLVNRSEFLRDSQKIRILKGIGRIEIEVQKTEGLWDIMLARSYEFLDLTETAGNKAKPIVDRFEQIKKITHDKTKGYDALPELEEQRRLPAPDDSEADTGDET